jgi:hypothetical protein
MRQHTRALIGLIVLLLVGAIVLYLYPPESLPIPRCPVLAITGWQCPGCGSLRGIHALLNGEIWKSLQLNILLIPALIYFTLLLILELLRTNYPRAELIYRKFSGRLAAWIIFAIIILWGIVRNIL